MGRVSALSQRLFLGLLAAGLVAGVSVALPDRWQSPWLVYGLAAACVIGALVIHRRKPGARRP